MCDTAKFDNQPITDLLQSVELPCEYCVGDTMDVPMPTIRVRDVGKLSFPVSDQQIDALIAIAEQGSYKVGEETIVSPTAYHRWHIDAEKVRISGRSWSSTLKKILNHVSKGLGIYSGELDADLDHLLIYKKGGYSTFHRDMEDKNGMIATLYLSLPTLGEGGELVVYHERQETLVDFTAHSPTEITFGAFYTNYLHDVRPITDGHRVYMVFNLFVANEGNWAGASNYAAVTNQVTDHLRQWKEHDQTEKIVYPLDYSYSENTLSFKSLKGSDAMVARILGQAADQVDCLMTAAMLCIYKIMDPNWDFDGGMAFDNDMPIGDDADFDGGMAFDNDMSIGDDAEFDGGMAFGNDMPIGDDAEFDGGMAFGYDFPIGDDVGFGDGMGPDGSTEIESLIDTYGNLENWVATDGSFPPFGELALTKEEVLFTDAIHAADAEEIWSEGGMEYDESPSDLVYRIPCLVIWPKSKTFEIVMKTGIDYGVAWVSGQLHQFSKTEMTGFITQLIQRWPETVEDYEYHNRDGMLFLFVETHQIHLATQFLDDIVLSHYDGSENEALSKLVFMIGYNKANHFIQRLLETWIHKRPQQIYGLMKSITDQLTDVAPSWREVVKKWAQYTINQFPHVLEKCTEGDKTDNAEDLQNEDIAFDYVSILERPTLDHTSISNLLTFAWRLDLVYESIYIALTIVEFQKIITPDQVLAKALKTLHGIDLFSRSRAYQFLWRHSADFILERTVDVLEGPENWMIDASFYDTSELGAKLHEFCLHPDQRVRRFKVAKAERERIRRIIIDSQLEISYVTERKGNPHTLICTKNPVSHQRRLQQLKEDVPCIGRLILSEPLNIVDPDIEKRVKWLLLSLKRYADESSD